LKCMLSWSERSQGSPIEYENAQKRILEVFTQWKAPDNFKIESFVIRVGDWGGYMLLDCDDPAAVHKFCSMLPAFVFEARPVIPIETPSASNSKRLAFATDSNTSDTRRICHIHCMTARRVVTGSTSKSKVARRCIALRTAIW
jgi:muconolactone delta-isomerase